MIAAWKRGTLADKVFSTGSLVLSSMQIYFLGPLVLALLVYNLGIMDQPKYVPFTEDPAAGSSGLLHPMARDPDRSSPPTTPVWRAPR